MNKNGFILLLTAITVAVFTIWLNSYWVNNKGFQFIQKDKKIDYYLSNFTLLNVNSDGSMRYLVKGRHVIHQQSSKTSELIKPLLEAQNSNEEITSITADKAIQSEKNGPITLQGVVNVRKNSIDPMNRIEFETSDLLYNPLTKELSSNNQINLISNKIKLQGIGFTSKLDEEAIRILSDVNVEIQTK